VHGAAEGAVVQGGRRRQGPLQCQPQPAHHVRVHPHQPMMQAGDPEFFSPQDEGRRVGAEALPQRQVRRRRGRAMELDVAAGDAARRDGPGDRAGQPVRA
jgi:hypothetical protein